MPPKKPRSRPDEEDGYRLIRYPHDELDAYLKKVFKLSTSPTDALEDDDWSFIIKMSAYVEVALNELLKAHFNDRKLDTIIEKMGMGSDRAGKLAFTKALGLLPPKTWQFVALLSELRGHIVHRVSMLNLNLSDHIQGSDKKEAWKTVLVSHPDPTGLHVLGMIALLKPRMFIFKAVMGIMSRAALRTDRTKLDHEIDAWMALVGGTHIFDGPKVKKPPESNPS